MDDVCTFSPSPSLQHPSSPFDPGQGKHVLFFGDPMCSWCWGFSPCLNKIAAMAQDRAQFHVVMGGLRPGTLQPWDSALRAYIRQHWQDVAAKTGQPFDFARFDDDDFVYDTEPGCRSVVVARTLDPSRALPLYEALQRGFYAHNLDITDENVLADLAQSVGLDRTQFVHLFRSSAIRKEVADDFVRTQAFGVRGFPAVLCAEDSQYGFLTLGYRSFDALKGDLENWLQS